MAILAKLAKFGASHLVPDAPPPEIQSRYCAWHIRHMCIFSVWRGRASGIVDGNCWLWLGTTPVHSLVFGIISAYIICCFSSLLVNSGHFHFTSTLSTFLLVQLAVIKHGCHKVSCSYWQPQEGSGDAAAPHPFLQETHYQSCSYWYIALVLYFQQPAIYLVYFHTDTP